MARASTSAENAAVNGITAIAVALGINTGDPGTTGANEVSGGSYARQSITWGSASSGTAANSVAISVPIPAGSTVNFFSTWNQTTVAGSTYEIGGALSATIDFVTAGTLSVAIGALTLSAS